MEEGRLPNFKIIPIDELLSDYGIVFPNWEFTPPIENTYE